VRPCCTKRCLLHCRKVQHLMPFDSLPRDTGPFSIQTLEYRFSR
jgi:hypothetical protein